jgi:hypothetical protein
MPKFIVFTVDHDEQVAYTDFVDAPDSEEALETALEAQEDCCYGIAWTPDELRELALNCETQTPPVPASTEEDAAENGGGK